MKSRATEIYDNLQNTQEASKHIVIPAIKRTTPSTKQVIALICAIPKGYVTSWEKIQDYFKVMYQAERIELDYHLLNIDHIGSVVIPFWRIIGDRGGIHTYSRLGGCEHQIELLKNEGVPVCLSGNERKIWRVENYKKYMYPLMNIDFSDILDTDLPEIDRTTKYIQVLLEYDAYKLLDNEKLLIYANLDSKHNPSAELARLCREELTNRGVERNTDP